MRNSRGKLRRTQPREPLPVVLDPTGAVLLCRVSSKKQKEEGYSPAFQEKGGFDYADRNKLKINLERIFNFVESAYNEKRRKKFFEFLDYARTGPEQHILIPRVDRALRNPQDLARIDEFRRTTEKWLHFFDDGLTLHRKSPASDYLRLLIQGSVAAWYSEDLSIKVAKGLKEKAEQGGWPEKAGFGYMNVGDGKKERRRVVPNPETARWYVRIKELAATGYMSIDAIKARCEQEGCPHRLTRNLIERVIRNPFGTGRFIWKETWYEGDHTPLINWELHEAAVRGLERTHKPRYREHQWPYAGFLQCGLCGRAVVFEAKVKKLKDGTEKRHVYGHCSGVRYGSEKGCKNPYLTQADLDSALLNIAKSVDLDKAVVDYIMSELSTGADKEALERMTRLAVARRELAKLKGFIEQAYRDKMEGKITEEFWLQQTRQWQEEQIRRQEEVKRLDEGSPSNYIAAARKVLEPMIGLENQYKSRDEFERAALLRIICSNGLQRGKSIEPVYRNPYGILARGRASGNWLPESDALQNGKGLLFEFFFGQINSAKGEKRLLPHEAFERATRQAPPALKSRPGDDRLRRAKQYDRILRKTPALTRKDLAGRLGITSARLNQILGLLKGGRGR